MARTFAYCRVSTQDQTVENQVKDIEGCGFSVEPHRIVKETISGSSAAQTRPEFMRLLDRLEAGDCLIVTKLDRLGRNAIDVITTVQLLATRKIRVHVMALGGTDLTSSAGTMILTVIAAMAQFEKDLLIERTLAGQARARAEGVKFGAPCKLRNGERAAVLADLASGISVTQAARQAGVSRATVLRARKADTRGIANLAN